MATIQIIAPGMRGIDAKVDPLQLPRLNKLAHAINLRFEEGRIITRPGFYTRPLGIKGQFQGACLYSPSKGLSVESFGHCGTQLAIAAGGGIFLNGVTSTTVSPCPVKLEGTAETKDCEEKDSQCRGDVHLYQAENYLIVQNKQGSTFWYDGTGALVRSPGMAADSSQDELQHSHDTFDSSNFRNWLANGAELGIYAHGRIHQQHGNKIYVSDIIHKRGHLVTDDILLMEEQSLASHGGPLSTSSTMGRLVALEISPVMGTPYGEGALTGYYEGGVVTYNTAEVPRESRFDGDGKRITEGWDAKRLVDTRLNSVSATGRYAVARLPRDQLFRSFFGVHLLSMVLGQETLADEPVNTISQEVEPILQADDPALLGGVACGYWMRGQRYFVSNNLVADETVSSSPVAASFVSWNKASTRTQDRTPIPVWEGIWIAGNIVGNVLGIHKFTHIGLRKDEGAYGFLCSDSDRNIYFSEIQQEATEDHHAVDGAITSIVWALETGRYVFKNWTTLSVINDARFEGVFASKNARIRVYIRTDRSPKWKKWREFYPCDRELCDGQRLLKGEPLGKPPEGYREAAWFEFRVEGVGWAEIRSFEVEVTDGAVNSGKAFCTVVDCYVKDYNNPQLEL